MNVTLEKTNDLEGKLTVAVEEADYAEKVKASLKKIGQTRDIPGFRKGHIDMNQLRKRFGKMVKSDVLNETVYDAVIKYIVDNKLEILGQPLPVDVKEINLDEKDYTFEYEIGFAPELDIKIDKSVTLPFYNIAVEDHMVAEQDEELRRRNGERVNVELYEDRALVKGVLRELDAEGNSKAEGVVVEDGIVGPFTFKDKDEAAKFEGKKVGETVVFNPFKACEGNEAEMASMLHVNRDEVEAHNGDFAFEIKEMLAVRLAEHNQAFYDAVFGAGVVTDEAQYDQKVREGIAQALQPNSANLFQRQAEDYLMATYGDMKLPVAFLEKLMERRKEDGETLSAEEMVKQATPSLKWDLIENKVASLLEVKVTEEDVKTLAHNMAASTLMQYGMTQLGDEMVDYYANNILQDKQQRERIARQAFMQQMFGKLHAAVSLDEKTVTLDEFRNLVASLSNDSGETEAAAE